MSRSGQISKARAICVILLILVSTATMIGLLFRFGLIQEPSNNDGSPHFSDCPFEVTTVSTAEGTWVSFNPDDDPGTPAEAHVIVSDTMGLTVIADISGYWKDNKTQIIDATSYSFDTIHVPGMHPIRTSGTPDLPHLIAYVEVPKDIDIAVEEIRGSHHILEGYSVGPNPSLPASTWPRDAQSVPWIEFGDIYDSNAFYPLEKVSITGGDSAASIIMRGRRLLEIKFHPIQYNASSNDLRVHARLMARLNYSRPAQIEPARPGLQCEQFENVFDGFLLNYKLWNASAIAPTEPDTFPDSSQFTIASFPSERLAAEYLIIVHDDFIEEAERLARWKNRTGLLTRFYTTSQIVEFAGGSGDVTPQQIKSFIQYTYSTWNPGPMFVLLFGDSEYVPTNYVMVHKDSSVYHQEQGFIGEDLEYFTVDGADYIPDLFYGRISVDSVVEARRVVDKILTYERSPPVEAAFYNNILAASYFDDVVIDDADPPEYHPDGDGMEDDSYPY
ncbi:MAG: C25 family cysteine peptidase, partial [Promethearchaeota archaeon]